MKKRNKFIIDDEKNRKKLLIILISSITLVLVIATLTVFISQKINTNSKDNKVIVFEYEYFGDKIKINVEEEINLTKLIDDKFDSSEDLILINNKEQPFNENTYISINDELIIIDVEIKESTKPSIIHFETEVRDEIKVARGETLHVQKGEDGRIEEKIISVYHNGKLVDSEIVDRVVVKEAVKDITLNGIGNKTTITTIITKPITKNIDSYNKPSKKENSNIDNDGVDSEEESNEKPVIPDDCKIKVNGVEYDC